MNTFAKKQKRVKEQAACQAIYEATLQVITRQQGNSLKMQTIAETAGIATGTLYNYFKNKVELLTFVDENLHADILGRIESVLDSSVSPSEKLKAVIRHIFAFFSEHHFVFDLTEKFGTKLHVPKSDKLDRLNAAQTCIETILRQGVDQGRFKPLDTKITAKYILSLLIGVIEVQDWLQDYELSKEADTLADFLLSNLTNPQV